MALSILVALFIASPASALVGTPDNVPGYDVQMPFFLVGIDGGVDTLMVIQEVGGNTYIGPGGALRVVGTGANKGSCHAIIYDRYSVDRGSWTFTYTPNDVYPISIRQAILDYVGQNDVPFLEVDVDGNGVADHYAGYIYVENSIWDIDPVTAVRLPWPLNNLIGKQYLVNLPIGLASGANMISREWCGYNQPAGSPWNGGTWWNTFSTTFYQWAQYTTTGSFGLGVTPQNLEVFNSEAYAISSVKEHLSNTTSEFFRDDCWCYYGILRCASCSKECTVATSFALTPRFYLRSATANSFFFLWTDVNHGALPGVPAGNWTWRNTVNLYNEDEFAINMNLNIPYELNFVNFADELPGGDIWAPPIAGWLDLNTLDANTGISVVNGITASQWLGSTYQTDTSANAGLNWAALFEVHRDVGTL